MLKHLQKYRHSFWSGMLLTIKTLAGFGAQKTVAILYGPAGTTVFSHFQNLVSLFTQPIQDAVGNGVVNAFSKRSFQNRQVIGAAIIILILLTSLSGIFVLISQLFKEDIFSFSWQNWLFIIPSIFFFCLGLVAGSIYVVKEKLKLFSLIISLQWFIFFAVVLNVKLNLIEFLIFWLCIQSAFSSILLYPIYPYLKFSFKIEKEVKQHFMQFLVIAITIWFASKWVDYFIRELSFQQFGAIETGLWQSVVRISESYRGLLLSFLFLSFYPMISSRLADKELTFSAFRKYYWPYLLFAFLFLFLVYQFDEIIIKVLYDKQYLKATSLFHLQIIGDLFAFLAFPFSIYLLARVKTKIYIFTELSSAFIFVIVILLGTALGIEILVYAHIIRFVSYLFLVSFFGIKSLRYEE